jgi:hypothetical protein
MVLMKRATTKRSLPPPHATQIACLVATKAHEAAKAKVILEIAKRGESARDAIEAEVDLWVLFGVHIATEKVMVAWCLEHMKAYRPDYAAVLSGLSRVAFADPNKWAELVRISAGLAA